MISSVRTAGTDTFKESHIQELINPHAPSSGWGSLVGPGVGGRPGCIRTGAEKLRVQTVGRAGCDSAWP